jgi:hypothetical protein
MPDIAKGTVLRAEVTGKTYRVQSVDYQDDTVTVAGLRPVPLSEIQKDITDGRITVVR